MSLTHRITILPGNRTVSIRHGLSLYEALREASDMPDAICGGNGTCGKCMVERVEDGISISVLACQTVVDRDMTIRLPEAGQTQVLLAGRSDVDPSMTVQPEQGFAVAFDVGTTTIVCYLLDTATGKTCASLGALNPQISYGADVITRAKAALTIGPEPLQAAVLCGMNLLLSQIRAKVGIDSKAITSCCIVGNSCMQHLLLGLSVHSLVTAPYVPVSLDAVETTAAAIKLDLDQSTKVRVLPLIGGFVGADTVGCLLATHFDRLTGNTLLLDIGTNGELVLGTQSRRIACSAAAGPAFEGGKILCGMRGSIGAITHVALSGNNLTLSVMGGGKPLGLCGSGLIDLIACLLQAGALDASGRLSEHGAFASRIIRYEGMRAFLLASEEETASGHRLLLTQRDVREVQLAKSAIASAITLLAAEAHIAVADIDRVLLAGAFGNYLDTKSACAIGLIPASLQSKVTPVGNAAGSGASLAACNDAAFRLAQSLARGTECIDPASIGTFQQVFLDGLAFLAPSVLP